MRTRPRTPCGAATTASRTRSLLISSQRPPSRPRPAPRLRAHLQPMRNALLVERDALRVLARQQRVVGAELLDEAAVARAARIGHDDPIERPLLGAATSQANAY